MADKKISQLTNASTPLAGTEVLPIVQSSATVKVATNDLTVKNVRSNATTGILQIAGPAAAATRTMTVPDANFTVARTDAANSFTSDQTLADGNLVVGTAAKGIDFSANTGAAGMTSELLDWYEEGTWTPSYTATAVSFTYDEQYGSYTRIGRMVVAQFRLKTATATGTTANPIAITGLPFTSANLSSLSANGTALGLQTFPSVLSASTNNNSTDVTLWVAGTTSAPTAADSVGAFLIGTAIYFAA